MKKHFPALKTNRPLSLARPEKLEPTALNRLSTMEVRLQGRKSRGEPFPRIAASPFATTPLSRDRQLRFRHPSLAWFVPTGRLELSWLANLIPLFLKWQLSPN